MNETTAPVTNLTPGQNLNVSWCVLPLFERHALASATAQSQRLSGSCREARRSPRCPKHSRASRRVRARATCAWDRSHRCIPLCAPPQPQFENPYLKPTYSQYDQRGHTVATIAVSFHASLWMQQTSQANIWPIFLTAPMSWCMCNYTSVITQPTQTSCCAMSMPYSDPGPAAQLESTASLARSCPVVPTPVSPILGPPRQTAA